jgi:hypothetical protein
MTSWLGFFAVTDARRGLAAVFEVHPVETARLS